MNWTYPGWTQRSDNDKIRDSAKNKQKTRANRPNILDVEAVVDHVQQTDDVVMIQPPAPGATRYLWGTEDGGLYLMHCGKCNYAGKDALRRFQSLQNGQNEMRWRDGSKKHVMSNSDDQIRETEA